MKRYIGIFLITGIGFASCQNEETEKVQKEVVKEKEVAVEIEKVETSNEPLPIESTGILASNAEIDLSFKTPGIIEFIGVKEGQTVRKGQLLASLNQLEIKSTVSKAKAALEKAERDLLRIKNLYADSVVTLENLQDAETAYDLAKSDWNVAVFNEKHSQIYAPENGKILRKYAETNELTGVGIPVIHFASTKTDQIIRIGVADRQVVQLELNDKAEVTFDAYPEKTFEAKVAEIAEAADPQTGVFEVELVVLNKGKALRNGFIGKVKIFPSQEASFLKIPIDAIVEADNKAALIFQPDVNKQKANEVFVKPLFISDQYILVSQKENVDLDYVVTAGAAYLKDGMRIKVAEKKGENLAVN